MIDFLLGKNRKIKFFPEKLQEGTEELRNPWRGWYQIYTVVVSEQIDLYSYKGCLENNDTLALVLLDLGKYSNKPLDDAALQSICTFFDLLIQSGHSMMIRPVYDTEGKCMEKEPQKISVIEGHMKQLGGLFWQYCAYIHCIQGLFVGNWGEMHGSKFLTENFLLRLANCLWKAMDGSCFMAVRTPCQHRLLCKRSEVSEEKLGIYDDALFGSNTHLGTFGTIETANYFDKWLPEKELNYMQKCCCAVNGGEVVSGYEVSAEEMIRQLRNMQISYLNRIYEESRLQEWKNTFFTEKELFETESLYQYIGRHLGYRFLVTKAKLLWKEKKPQFCVTIRNDGFGSFHRKSTLFLLVCGEKKTRVPFCSEVSVSRLKPGEEREYSITIPLMEDPAKELNFYLGIVDENERVIYFANQGAKEKVFLGKLMK